MVDRLRVQELIPIQRGQQLSLGQVVHVHRLDREESVSTIALVVEIVGGGSGQYHAQRPIIALQANVAILEGHHNISPGVKHAKGVHRVGIGLRRLDVALIARQIAVQRAGQHRAVDGSHAIAIASLNAQQVGAKYPAYIAQIVAHQHCARLRHRRERQRQAKQHCQQQSSQSLHRSSSLSLHETPYHFATMNQSLSRMMTCLFYYIFLINSGGRVFTDWRGSAPVSRPAGAAPRCRPAFRPHSGSPARIRSFRPAPHRHRPAPTAPPPASAPHPSDSPRH